MSLDLRLLAKSTALVGATGAAVLFGAVVIDAAFFDTRPVRPAAPVSTAPVQPAAAPAAPRDDPAPAAADTEPKTEMVAVDDLEPPAHLSAGQRVLFEKAVSMLNPQCKQTVGSNTCHQFADQFAREFVNAVAGDYTAQSNTSFAFVSNAVAKPNAMAACGMRQLMAWSHDPRYTKEEQNLTVTDCWLDGQDLTDQAQVQASRLLHAQQAHPIKRIAVPELGFDPTKSKEEDEP